MTGTPAGRGADSLTRRFAFKLLANFLGMAVGAVTQAIVPRGLGPAAYGDYNFLTAFFTRVTSFLDMGTSIGFYTKLSQRPEEPGLVLFYLGYAGIAAGLTLLFVGVAFPANLAPLLWPGQSGAFIFLGALLCALLWLTQLLIKMADAHGLTVHSEVARMAQKVLTLALVAGLYLAGHLDLWNYFWTQCLAALLLGLIVVWILKGDRRLPGRTSRLTREETGAYSREFFAYSHPLFIHSVASLLTGILDRWLLQVYGGNIQQGFFGLSYQIGAICFLFPAAMEPLLTREFSIAFGKDDRRQMAVLYERLIPLLYAVAAYFSCFVAVQAKTVVAIMGGAQYHGALTAVTIMALFPLHQTYGQLCGAVFYATGQTALYRNIAITFMALGLPVSYFLIAPAEHWGLAAGATGLALKTAGMNIVTVNVLLYFNARYLGLAMGRFLWHQVYSVAVLLSLAFAASRLSALLLGGAAGILPGFLAAGCLYSALTAAVAWSFPSVFGLSLEDARRLRARVRDLAGRRPAP